jgi:hypothetical protein
MVRPSGAARGCDETSTASEVIGGPWFGVSDGATGSGAPAAVGFGLTRRILRLRFGAVSAGRDDVVSVSATATGFLRRVPTFPFGSSAANLGGESGAFVPAALGPRIRQRFGGGSGASAEISGLLLKDPTSSGMKRS